MGALEDVATVFKPLTLVLFNILMLGGEEAEKNAGKSGNNLQGKILYNLVNIKAGKKQDSKPALFNDLVFLAEGLEEDFAANARRSSQKDFWRSSLFKMSKRSRWPAVSSTPSWASRERLSGM